MEIKAYLKNIIEGNERGISLGIYRISFGLLMCFSLLRFWYKDWIELCYLAPSFHFSYDYFDFVKPILSPAWGMYFVLFLTVFFTVLLAIGWWYRFAAVCFFIFFTYLELIEKSWYLNHYYFVSLIAFLLIWMPADNCFSLQKHFSKKDAKLIPTLYANILRLQISLVYFFAGLAKINQDWLLHAQPLKIWLKTKIDIPIIGDLLAYDATAYLFSYSGMLYDLLIPFFLWNKKTRPFAFLAVLIFHSMTAVLFQIGMFPWIMIVGSLIFITDKEWESIFSFFQFKMTSIQKPVKSSFHTLKKGILFLFIAHFTLQIVLPLRHFFYTENHAWTERHYRFGWNVMLNEKTGSTIFKVKETATGRTWKEYPSTHLDAIQEKQMSYQPDMIWQYAQFLKDKYQKKGVTKMTVFVHCYVTFNGRPSQLFLPKDLNLLELEEAEIYDYVLDLEE